MWTLLLFLLPTIIIFLLSKRKKFQKILQPPGPPRVPLIGNFHQFLNITPSLHEYLWQLSLKYGPLMSMRLGSVPVVVICSAKLAEQALKTHDLAFSGRPQTLVLQKLSYNGLDVAFAPYSDYWKDMRKITVLHLFSLKRVQFFRHIREDEVANLITNLAELAASSQLANMSEMLISFSSNMTSRIAFGKRAATEGIERKRFNELFHEAQVLMGSIFYSDYFPSLHWIDKLSGKVGRLEKNFKEFDCFYQEILEEHLNKNDSKSCKEEDMVDILLRLRNEKSYPYDFTLDNIKAILMNILIGGTDAVAATVIWAMTELVKNPMVMEKVQAEIRTLAGKKDVIINQDEIKKFPFFKALMKETLRMHPPAPLLVPRETTEKCILDGYEIQRKSLVYVNAWAIARDPEYWENPHEFMPERFLGCNLDYMGQNFELIPFGAGRRSCPGINLGLATAELALANLLRSFDWELPPGMKKEDVDMEVLPGFTMHKKKDLCLAPKILSLKRSGVYQ